MIRRKLNFNILIIFLLVIVIIFSLFYGAVRVPILEVIKILLNKIGITNYEITRKSFISIVYYVRFPRNMNSSHCRRSFSCMWLYNAEPFKKSHS